MYPKPAFNPGAIRTALVAGTVLLALLSSGCTVDLKRVAYQAIRQGDCRLNEPDNACQANYTSEYQEYARLREDFLRETNEVH